MIKVKVPGTSANIGPGFDALGLALNMYNSFIFEEIDKGLEISGCNKAFANKNNLVYKSMLRTFDKIGYSPKGIRIDMSTDIPISRGLGSSASCILGGVIGANHLAGEPLSKDEVLELATEIEGHPDNIAPALFGGFVVSVMENKRVIYNNIHIPKGIKFIALIPDFTLSTKEARAVLPSTVSYKDAIYNVGRVSLLLSALSNGRFDLLKYAVNDTLHEQYRGKLIPNYFNIVNKCREAGCLGVFLSGAGSTIMTIIDNNDNEFKDKINEFIDDIWDIREFELDLVGVSIQRMY